MSECDEERDMYRFVPLTGYRVGDVMNMIEFDGTDPTKNRKWIKRSKDNRRRRPRESDRYISPAQFRVE